MSNKKKPPARVRKMMDKKSENQGMQVKLIAKLNLNDPDLEEWLSSNASTDHNKLDELLKAVPEDRQVEYAFYFNERMQLEVLMVTQNTYGLRPFSSTQYLNTKDHRYMIMSDEYKAIDDKIVWTVNLLRES